MFMICVGFSPKLVRSPTNHVELVSRICSLLAPGGFYKLLDIHLIRNRFHEINMRMREALSDVIFNIILKLLTCLCTLVCEHTFDFLGQVTSG